MGLFPEIQRAYITVDNKLFLWNYINGEEFSSFEDYQQTITYIKLVQPKQGVFVDAISYLLVIATPAELFLLGVNRSPEGVISLYQTHMSVPIRDVRIAGAAATEDGRIFFGGSDGQVYEITYKAEEGRYKL